MCRSEYTGPTVGLYAPCAVAGVGLRLAVHSRLHPARHYDVLSRIGRRNWQCDRDIADEWSL